MHYAYISLGSVVINSYNLKYKYKYPPAPLKIEQSYYSFFYAEHLSVMQPIGTFFLKSLYSLIKVVNIFEI